MGKKTLKDLYQQLYKPSEALPDNTESAPSDVPESLPQQRSETTTKKKDQYYFLDSEGEEKMVSISKEKVQQKKEKSYPSKNHEHCEKQNNKQGQEKMGQMHQVQQVSHKLFKEANDQNNGKRITTESYLKEGLLKQILVSQWVQKFEYLKDKYLTEIKAMQKNDQQHYNQAIDKDQLINNEFPPPYNFQKVGDIQISEKLNKKSKKTQNTGKKAEIPKSQRSLRPKNDQINYKQTFNSSLLRVNNFNQTVRHKSEVNKESLIRQKSKQQQQLCSKKMQVQQQGKSQSHNYERMDVQSYKQAGLNMDKQSENQNGNLNIGKFKQAAGYVTPAKVLKNIYSINKNKARENHKNMKVSKDMHSKQIPDYNSIFNQIRTKVVSDIRLQMAQNNNSINKSNNLVNLPSSEEMPELALRCAQFFHSLSKYCLSYYQNYNREQASQKTKRIHKLAHPKKSKMGNKFNDKNDGDKKNEKDQALPKKPLTAYIIYFQEKKPSFVEKYKGLNLSELTKLIAKQWTELPQHDKQPYLDKAADDRKRYDQELAEYRKKCGKFASQMNQAALQQASEDNDGNLQVHEQKDKDQGAIQIEQ